jgi:hypothetical protein
LRELFLLLKVKNNPLKHWLDSIGWRIAEAMHDMVLLKVAFAILEANYVANNANEVTTINVQ